MSSNVAATAPFLSARTLSRMTIARSDPNLTGERAVWDEGRQDCRKENCTHLNPTREPQIGFPISAAVRMRRNITTTSFVAKGTRKCQLDRALNQEEYFEFNLFLEEAYSMSLLTRSVVVVSPFGCVPKFRNALVDSGATAHVFSNYAAALTLLRRKKIDTVVIQFARDAGTIDFCEAVRALNIPLVFASPAAICEAGVS